MNELTRLRSQVQKKSQKKFDPVLACTVKSQIHAKQLAYALDSHKKIAVAAGRRGGKTTGAAVRAIRVCRSKPDAIVYYCHLSIDDAYKVFYTASFKKLAKRLGIVHEVKHGNEIHFPNGSVIHLRGLSTIDSLGHFLGDHADLFIVDEAHKINERIFERLVKEVVVPFLRDTEGTLVLAGVPSPVHSGTYYNAYHNPLWSHHTFTMDDNPMWTPESNEVYRQEQISEIYGSALDPTFRREFLAEWVIDTNLTVYKYMPAPLDGFPSCHIERKVIAEMLKASQEWRFTCGVDFGGMDRDAIVVLGQNFRTETYYWVDEFVTERGTDTAYGWFKDKLAIVREKYPRCAMFMDTGGSRKMFVTLQSDGFPLAEAVKKTDVRSSVSLVNQLLRTGRLKIPMDTDTARDMMKTLWDADALKRGIWKYDSIHHPDPADALRYSLDGIHEKWFQAKDTRTPEQRMLDHLADLRRIGPRPKKDDPTVRVVKRRPNKTNRALVNPYGRN